MRIATTSGYVLSSPIELPQDRPFHGGTRRLLKHDVAFVVIEPVGGTRGIIIVGAGGSTTRKCFEGDSQGIFVDTVIDVVADVLEGKSIEGIENAHTILRDTDLPDRPRHEAISALDVALYDIRGKQVGTPIYELFADDYSTDPTTRMPLYASVGTYVKPEGYAKQAATIHDLGFFDYKYRPSIGPGGDRRTIELFSDVTDEMEVVLDAHMRWEIRGGYDHETVEDLVTLVAEWDHYQVEEPVPPDDCAGYVDLAAAGALLAGGENESTPDGLVALGEMGAVALLQDNVRHRCGYIGCRPAVELCVDRDVEFVPHSFGTWVDLFANARLVVAVPEVSPPGYSAFEDDLLLNAETDPGMYPSDLAFDIIKGQPAVEDGVLPLSSEPGLGVEVNFDVFDDCPFRDRPRIEFHYDENWVDGSKRLVAFVPSVSPH